MATRKIVLIVVCAPALMACRGQQPAPAADPPATVLPAAPAIEPKRAEETYPRFAGLVDKDLLVGIWNGAAELGSGWDDAYLFWPDGRFELRYSQMNCAKRTLVDKGFWTLDGKSAILTVHAEIVALGGELIDSTGSCASRQKLVGAQELRRAIEPPSATRIDLGLTEVHPDFDSPILVIEKRRFFKKGDDPDSYE